MAVVDHTSPKHLLTAKDKGVPVSVWVQVSVCVCVLGVWVDGCVSVCVCVCVGGGGGGGEGMEGHYTIWIMSSHSIRGATLRGNIRNVFRGQLAFSTGKCSYCSQHVTT